MNDNLCRHNLVTKFYCSECGNQLRLSYSYNSKKGFKEEFSDGITGAEKVENKIYIEPCHKCIEVPMEQLETLRKIVKG